jgi:predicted ATP-grasp superfamily ATP-dependent carboligase
MIYVDPENDVVAVVRWVDPNPKIIDEFVKRLLGAVNKK